MSVRSDLPSFRELEPEAERLVEALDELGPVVLDGCAELHLDLQAVLTDDHVLGAIAIWTGLAADVVIDVDDVPGRALSCSVFDRCDCRVDGSRIAELAVGVAPDRAGLPVAGQLLSGGAVVRRTG